MMRRYTTKPRAIWVEDLGEECPDLPQITVYEDDCPQSTGLLDAQGNELYRVDEKEPIGFKVNGKSYNSDT